MTGRELIELIHEENLLNTEFYCSYADDHPLVMPMDKQNMVHRNLNNKDVIVFEAV